ncbi:MAG TPA: SBBP repeat-containing protein [Chloroflexia bacterium]|nr:SBBP repeat-containing protein [Chloroflexia bacterium]
MRVRLNAIYPTFRRGGPPQPMLLVMVSILSLSAMLLMHDGGLILQRPSGLRRSENFSLDKMPLIFEANAGQVDQSVSYSARRPDGTLLFTDQGIDIAVGRQMYSSQTTSPPQGVTRSPVVSLQFVGANPDLRLEGTSLLSGKVNYFTGSDSSGWRTNVTTYEGLTYREIYPGISLSYVGSGTGLKGTYTVSPNADPALIRWRYVGVNQVEIAQSGNLVMSLDDGRTTEDEGSQSKIVESAPVAWQEIDGQRVSVSARFTLAVDGTASFSLGAYDPTYPLTIDPVLTYSTYFGGSSSDAGYGIAVDAAGNIYLAGQTGSTDFPLEDPFQPSSGGSPDAFITKFNPSGTELIYSTYFGGSGLEWPRGIAIDAAGNVAIAGRTSSTNLPLMNPVQSALAGSDDVFVTKLNSTGSGLIFSTYLGGSNWDEARSVAEDPSGNVYVSGETRSTNFPLMNPLQSAFGGGLSDAFVTKISSLGSQLIYSTYLGGEQTFGGDIGFGIAADANGNAYVTGDTTAMDFPVANAFQPTNHGGESEAFVSKINPSGSAFVYSTYLGGGQASSGSGADTGYAIAADASGNAYITGDTDSTDFPIRNAVQPQLNGFYDVFVAKMNPTGSDLVYATYLGGENGSGNERGQGIAVDPAGSASVVGITDSPDFPMVNAVDPMYGTAIDAFAFRLTPSGSALSFSTYLGGSNSDYGQAAAVDGSGNTYATGLTASTNFPLANPYQSSNAAPFDLFISKISDVSFVTATPAGTITSLPTSTNTAVPATSTPHASTPTSTPGQPSSTATVAPTSTATAVATSAATSTPGAATSTPTVCTITFSDVPQGHTFYAYVRCLACQGILGGYDDGTFRPDNLITRGQIAKVVSNAAAIEDEPGPQVYEDVASDNTFYIWINRLSLHGYMGGYPCGGEGEPCGADNKPYFRPFSNATRGQLAKIVANAAGLGGDPTGIFYTDVPKDNPFYTWIMRLTALGAMSGYPCGGEGEPCDDANRPYFRPYNNVTRGQASKIVANAFFPDCQTPSKMITR